MEYSRNQELHVNRGLLKLVSRYHTKKRIVGAPMAAQPILLLDLQRQYLSRHLFCDTQLRPRPASTYMIILEETVILIISHGK